MTIVYGRHTRYQTNLQVKILPKTYMSLAIGIVTSLILLGLALYGTEVAQIVSSIRGANFVFAPVIIICLFACYWLRAQRWMLLLQPTRRTTATSLFPIIMVGHLTNLVLPMHMGEVVRSVIASRKTDSTITSMLTSILLERIFDLLAVLGLLALAILAGQQLVGTFERAGLTMALLLLVLIGLVLSYLIWTPAVVRVVKTLSAFLPSNFRERLLHQVEMGAQGLQALRSPVLLAKIAWSTVVQWSIACLYVYCSLQAFSIEVPPSAVFLTLALMVLVTWIVPSAPGFIGSIQLAYSLALDPFNVSPSTAFAASVFYHFLMYSFVLLVGFGCLRVLGYGFESLRVKSTITDNTDEPVDLQQ